jgi:hypothetical protein
VNPGVGPIFNGRAIVVFMGLKRDIKFHAPPLLRACAEARSYAVKLAQGVNLSAWRRAGFRCSLWVIRVHFAYPRHDRFAPDSNH